MFARGSRGREQLLVGSAAAVAVWVLFGKVLSPQYLLWLVPLVALVVGRRPAKLAFPLGLVAALGLTQAVYPGRYDELIRLDALPIALLAARNALLVVLAAALLSRLQGEGDTQTPDRSFQTDAQAKPARPDVGTANGA